MDGTRSRDALDQFLRYLGDKGLMAAATVGARRAAVSKVLGILDDDEARDVTVIDVDDLATRFSRLHGKNYTPESLTTYKSRLKSALFDFDAYLSNPLAFRPAGQSRSTKTGAKQAQKDSSESGSQKTQLATSENIIEQSKPVAALMPNSNILPIPIRHDLIVYIQGLPYDLTESEARKIAGVVSAMAAT